MGFGFWEIFRLKLFEGGENVSKLKIKLEQQIILLIAAFREKRHYKTKILRNVAV